MTASSEIPALAESLVGVSKLYERRADGGRFVMNPDGEMNQTSGPVKSIHVPSAEAQQWCERSLRQGFDLSTAVQTRTVVGRGNFMTLVPAGFKREHMEFAFGMVAKRKLAIEALGRCLDELSPKGAKCVLIENDMLRAGDPVVEKQSLPLGFMGDRVIHWCGLDRGGRICADAVSTGAAGYPLNAFVTSISEDELGLIDHQEVEKEVADRVAGSLVALICSAFDAESFLIWTP